MLKDLGTDIKGKTIAISGFGNVAWGAATKATELGGKVVTISGPDGYIYDHADKFPGSQFFAGRKPWEQKVDIVLPCATQNEVGIEDAKNIIANKVMMVAEVSNMGCQAEAIDAFIAAKLPYAPGKAVNAGGVAVSGLEMSQDAEHLQWSAKEVDDRLHTIMADIHENCVKFGTQADGYINYMKGANIAGFMKVADAMLAQGII